MRRVESPLKVQWRVLVGIEGCLHRRLRILTSLNSVYVLVMFVCFQSISLLFSSCVKFLGVCVMFNFWLWMVHVTSLAFGSLRVGNVSNVLV
ncbi:hypothetical protein Bca101_068655 [Brassica carinata]